MKTILVYAKLFNLNRIIARASFIEDIINYGYVPTTITTQQDWKDLISLHPDVETFPLSNCYKWKYDDNGLYLLHDDNKIYSYSYPKYNTYQS